MTRELNSKGVVFYNCKRGWVRLPHESQLLFGTWYILSLLYKNLHKQFTTLVTLFHYRNNISNFPSYMRIITFWRLVSLVVRALRCIAKAKVGGFDSPTSQIYTLFTIWKYAYDTYLFLLKLPNILLSQSSYLNKHEFKFCDYQLLSKFYQY